MTEQLHIYQSDLDSYVNTAEEIHRLLAGGVWTHLGGIEGKTVLDLGVGFQLVHGGLSWLLTSRKAQAAVSELTSHTLTSLQAILERCSFGKSPKRERGSASRALMQGV